MGPRAAAAATSDAVEALEETRARTLGLVASLSDDELERTHSPLMSPLVWDLGHIAAFEDLWLAHCIAGRPLLREDLAHVYDAFETPRADRAHLPLLGPQAAREYMEAVRARTLSAIEVAGVGNGLLYELVIRHEQQHNETMLQTLELAALDGYRVPGGMPDGDAPASPASPAGSGPRSSHGCYAMAGASFTGFEQAEIPGGPCTLGAPALGFAYDNERPRHRTDVRGYAIGRTPITNATYLTFVEGGGYERREWWSDEGWLWKEEYDITRPGAWTADLRAERRLDRLEPLHPHRPVVHVSWFEADAFARAHGARLPSEAEWEKAATWDQDAGRARRYPWGEDAPKPGLHANLDQLDGGPGAAGAHVVGASPYGCLGMIGDVWEWTASPFVGYPGFVAHPYREYSEAFFGPDYRVLRGGSWATRPRVATTTFRNWDFPQRRQIFSGFRLAWDL